MQSDDVPDESGWCARTSWPEAISERKQILTHRFTTWSIHSSIDSPTYQFIRQTIRLLCSLTLAFAI